MEIHYPAILLAAVVAVVVSTVWYLLLGRFRAEATDSRVSAKPPGWKIAVELGRCFLLAFILAHVFKNLNVLTIATGLRHAFWLWLGFPAILFVGLAVWENMPWRNAAIHSGDWLIKLLLIAAIIS